MTDAIPGTVKDRLAGIETTLALHALKLDNLTGTFEKWCKQVYEQGVVTQETIRANAATALSDAHNKEMQSADEKWEANTEAHIRIEARLDSLNGWRNKMLGILALVGFAAPVAVGVWAVVTKGG